MLNDQGRQTDSSFFELVYQQICLDPVEHKGRLSLQIKMWGKGLAVRRAAGDRAVLARGSRVP